MGPMDGNGWESEDIYGLKPPGPPSQKGPCLTVPDRPQEPQVDQWWAHPRVFKKCVPVDLPKECAFLASILYSFGAKIMLITSIYGSVPLNSPNQSPMSAGLWLFKQFPQVVQFSFKALSADILLRTKKTHANYPGANKITGNDLLKDTCKCLKGECYIDCTSMFMRSTWLIHSILLNATSYQTNCCHPPKQKYNLVCKPGDTRTYIYMIQYCTTLYDIIRHETALYSIYIYIYRTTLYIIHNT